MTTTRNKNPFRYLYCFPLPSTIKSSFALSVTSQMNTYALGITLKGPPLKIFFPRNENRQKGEVHRRHGFVY